MLNTLLLICVSEVFSCPRFSCCIKSVGYYFECFPYKQEHKSLHQQIQFEQHTPMFLITPVEQPAKADLEKLEHLISAK